MVPFGVTYLHAGRLDPHDAVLCVAAPVERLDGERALGAVVAAVRRRNEVGHGSEVRQVAEPGKVVVACDGGKREDGGRERSRRRWREASPVSRAGSRRRSDDSNRGSTSGRAPRHVTSREPIGTSRERPPRKRTNGLVMTSRRNGRVVRRVVKGVGHLGHDEVMEAGGREFDPRPGHYSRTSF